MMRPIHYPHNHHPGEPLGYLMAVVDMMINMTQQLSLATHVVNICNCRPLVCVGVRGTSGNTLFGKIFRLVGCSRTVGGGDGT